MAITLKPPKPLTYGELLEFSRRNPGYQFERSAQLEAWNRSRSSGLVFDSSTGFRMPDGAVLSPDASWVRRDRWERLAPADREGFAPLCPDAVFEMGRRTEVY